MLLDDDVVLARGCIGRLVAALKARPEFAAFAADCTGAMEPGLDHWDYPRHVTLASTLFRRDRLAELTFRGLSDRCDCQCACDDLRRAGFGIGYVPGAVAWHRPLEPKPHQVCSPATEPSPPPISIAADATPRAGRILVAFDRTHFQLFQQRFLASLRRSGNQELVTAVTSGLYPSEVRRLETTTGVEVVIAPNDGNPARRRPRDFARILADWPEDTPVAYWDAPDILFQRPVAELWDLVRSRPDRLLVASEVLRFGGNEVADFWINTISDPEARRAALALVAGRHVFNSGFAAGTADTMRRCLLEIDRILHSPAIHGSTDWADQTALNLYLYGQPDVWSQVSSTWNYCLVGLRPGDFRVRSDGQIERSDGTLAHVVHGNGKTFGPRTLACSRGLPPRRGCVLRPDPGLHLHESRVSPEIRLPPSRLEAPPMQRTPVKGFRAPDRRDMLARRRCRSVRTPAIWITPGSPGDYLDSAR